MVKRQAGLSLIELMIGIALSLLLILGVTQIFLSSKASYSNNQALSAVQENGRFAIELLSRDIRNAGYKGQCLSMPVNHLDGGSSDLWAQNDEPIHGWETAKPNFISRAVVAESDTLFIQFAAGANDVTGQAGNSASSNDISFDPNSVSIADGNVTLIADGLACDLFENKDSGSGTISKDAASTWSHDYTDDFEILTLQSVAYYVAEDDEGVPTLYRSRLKYDLSDEEAEPLVPGIASLNIEYGVGTNRAVNNYVVASSVTNWGNVSSVKLTLDVVSPAGLQKEFSTIVGLRNRLP
ncbi:PilW family protein [Halopseudomonas bauzanensis]|uniref:PilW family protein n=1 Tax=Halopseudomonas bauzanensis TaxID=653930 RepID=UPI002556AE21|nr:PilW family protein [Halopseudomonas bauzanensis]